VWLIHEKIKVLRRKCAGGSFPRPPSLTKGTVLMLGIHFKKVERGMADDGRASPSKRRNNDTGVKQLNIFSPLLTGHAESKEQGVTPRGVAV